jgi:hypothetical protein
VRCITSSAAAVTSCSRSMITAPPFCGRRRRD